MTADQVRRMLLEACAESLRAAGHEPQAVPDDLDLRIAGVVDSLGFLELVVELEDRLGVELDFATLDPLQLTVVGPLVAHVAAQARHVRANGAVEAPS